MLLMTFKCQSFHESRYRVFPCHWSGGNTPPILHHPETLSIHVLFSLRTSQFHSDILPYRKGIGGRLEQPLSPPQF